MNEQSQDHDHADHKDGGHDSIEKHSLEHGHNHAPADFGVAFAVGTALNIALVILQVTFGIIGNSVALLADAGQLLVISEKGEVVLVRANPEKLEELGRFSAIEGKTWNHPVLVGNRLYVRNAATAACYELALK